MNIKFLGKYSIDATDYLFEVDGVQYILCVLGDGRARLYDANSCAIDDDKVCESLKLFILERMPKKRLKRFSKKNLDKPRFSG